MGNNEDDLEDVVELVCHCRLEEPMYILAVSESSQMNSRGYPRKASVEVGADWCEKIQKAAKLLEIEYQEPAWLLSSLWS